MPRTTTRTQEPGDPRTPRRSGQDAAAGSAVADRERAGRSARDRAPESGRSPAEAAATGARPADQPPAPTYDDIARRAYELYQQRGGNEGQDVDDWLRAEAELRNGRGRRDDEL